MYISQITLNNYRNYTALKLGLSPGLNVFTGANAQGKTNLLEAIYFCSIGRSMRTPRDRELILWEQERARIKVDAVNRGGKSKVEIVLDKRQNKSVIINGATASRLGELMGVVTTVLFSPDEIAIIKESPSDRRRFMDIAICQLSRAYFYLLQRYNKTLAQRNKLLKGNAGSDTLDVWDVQLASVGAKVIKTRRGFIARIEELTKNAHSYLTDGKENITLLYETIDGETESEIYDSFLAELKRSRERDLIHGFTHIGAQTDDLAVLIDGVDVRKFGSQGQQRTAALSLKLAQLELFAAETGEYPVLLLDDVFSELDERRQRKLVEKLEKHQTVVTCTHLDGVTADAFKDAKLFRVEKGTVREI